MKFLDAILECNPFDDFREAVGRIELSPFCLSRQHQFERHGKAHLERIGAGTFDQFIKAIGEICDLFTPDE